MKPKSVFFWAQEGVIGGESLVGIVMTEVPNGCETYSSYLAAAAAASTPADLAAQWAANFPPDFWDATFLIRTPSAATPLAGPIPGIPWNEVLDQSPEAQGYFTHNLATRDVAYFDGTGQPGVYRKDYITNGGTLEVTKHTPGDSISGRFATFTVDSADGRPTGLLEITFSGKFCPGADLLDNAGQTAGTGGGS